MAELLRETSAIKEYWLEPDSRTVEPETLSVTNMSGKVIDTVPYSERAGLELRMSAINRTAILADFGREVGGRPCVTFGSGHCRRVGVQGVESIRHIFNPLVAEPVSIADYVVYYHHFKAAEGKKVELPHCGGFRYLWIYPERPCRATLKEVSVSYTPHLADASACGYFLCSDEQLNRIWYTGLHTLEMCVIDPALGGADSDHRIGKTAWVLVDGAKRDRLVWTADLAPAGAALYTSFGETDIIRDSLLSLSDFQDKSGYIPACSPGPIPARVAGGFLADYVAWWVVTLSQYYLHTGDTELVRELFAVMKRALAYLHGQCRGGLFRQTPMNMAEWCFTVLRLGKPSYTNVMYYWALNGAAVMAHAIGEEDLSVGFVSRAFRLGEAIERELMDEARGVLVDTTADPGRVPQDANVLAIIAGLIEEPFEAMRALDYMRRNMWVDWGSTNVDIPYYRLTPGIPPHNKRVIPFMNNYEALARFAAGDEEGALELIRRCWGNMIDNEPGTTFWEWAGKDGRADAHFTSLCHAWSSGVTALLSKYVLGIRPRDAGYSSFAFDPHPCGLDWVEGRVPVPGGFIEARIEKKKNGEYERRIKAPKGLAQAD